MKKLKYKKCLECEINYIPIEEDLCGVCKEKQNPKVRYSSNSTSIVLPTMSTCRYNGRAVFYVFQSTDMFILESHKGYIIAPREGKNGVVPHHWYRLNEVKPDDIIIHGVGGYIRAISVAKGMGYCSQYDDGRLAWKVDCQYITLKNPIAVEKFQKEIVKLCAIKRYQPFNKNGTGNQGYLFDIDRDLAKVFLEEAARCNNILVGVSQLKWLLE